MFETEQGQDLAPTDQQQQTSVDVESLPTENGVSDDPWANFSSVNPRESAEGSEGQPNPDVQVSPEDGRLAEPPAAPEEGFENLEMDQVSPRAQDRIRQLVGQNKQVSQQVEQFNQMSRGLDSSEVQQAMEIARLIKTDPRAAMEKLSPIFGEVALDSGAILPQDLQTAVNNGEISEQLARQMAEMRTKDKFAQRQSEQFQREQQHLAQQRVQQEFSDVGNNLEREFQADPDYGVIKPYFEASISNELNRIAQQVQAGQRQPISAQELEQITRNTFAKTREGLMSLKGGPAARRPVTTTSPAVGTQAAQEAKSLGEAQSNAWSKFS